MSAAIAVWLTVAILASFGCGWCARRDWLRWRFQRAAESGSPCEMTAVIAEATGATVLLRLTPTTAEDVEP